jgi:hypothetical protein
MWTRGYFVPMADYQIQSILQSYQPIERSEANSKEPRTLHNIQNQITKLEKQEIPQTISQQHVLAKLFAPIDGNALLEHPSDLEDSHSEYQFHESTSSYELLPPSHNMQFRNYFVYVSDEPHSALRSVAQQLFGDELMYTTITENLESPWHEMNYRELLQNVSNLYIQPIHVYQQNTQFIEIISPTNSWGQQLKEPIPLLKYASNSFAALTATKNVKVTFFNADCFESGADKPTIEF